MSSREADVSDELSIAVGMEIGNVFVPHFDEWSIEKQEAFAQRIDHPVRKCAHAGEYAVLGILWLGALLPGARGKGELSTGQACIRRMRACWYQAWLLASLYAATDEFHQLFVKGRSGQVSDVLIDSAGAAVGVLLVRLVWKRKLELLCGKSV